MWYNDVQFSIYFCVFRKNSARYGVELLIDELWAQDGKVNDYNDAKWMNSEADQLVSSSEYMYTN